jgi:adenylate cyclase
MGLASWFVCNTQWFYQSAPVVGWEGQAHNLRFQQRGNLKPSSDVVLVGVTSSSFDPELLEKHVPHSETIRRMYESGRPPLPRGVQAAVIERLLEAGAKVVAIDFVFFGQTPEDSALVAVLKKYPGRVVMAASVQRSKNTTQLTSDAALGLQVTYLRPDPQFTDAAGPASEGFVDFWASGTSSDTARRRFDYRTSDVREEPELAKLGFQDQRDLWKFAPLAVSKFTGRDLPSDYDCLINYSGPSGTILPIPIEELFIDAEWSHRHRSGAAFRDKLVFYGPVAEIFKDELNTPYGQMPGVEIHAQLASNLIRGDILRDASNAATRTLSLLTVLAAVCVLLFVRHPAFQALGLVTLFGAYWMGTLLLFSHKLVWFPSVPALAATFVTGAVGIVFLFILERRNRTQTLRLLERSINKRIAAVMLRNPDEIARARTGERRKVAVLFTDIRNFTVWAENAPADHLVGQLNDYFVAMVPLIEDTFGNAQKFIGDAILSAWGDVEENDFGEVENCSRAITAALMMRPKLRELNESWAKRDDRILISIGMGINHGYVIAGTVGHPERIEFTVLGDGVNFAARLETATKQFQTDCLVGESAEALTKDRFIFRFVGNLRVKGKAQPVRIFTPLSDARTPPPEWLVDYHRAISFHDARQFAEAIALFRDVKRRAGGEDFLCDWYVEKCEAFIASPPPPDWDGSHTLTEK